MCFFIIQDYEAAVVQSYKHRTVVEVRDAGQGILPEVMTKLFNSLSTTKENGTEFGTKMALLKNMVGYFSKE